MRRNERGVQLAEAALVLPVLLILLAATAEFGRYFYVYSTLSRATRTAVRHISSREYTTTKQTEAKRLALCGNVTTDCASGTEILSGLTMSHFVITPNGGSTNLPATVTVEVSGYNYQPIFNLGSFVSGVTWANVAVRPKTTMRYMLSN